MSNNIELIAKIKPKNNGTFPLVDDKDIEMEDGTRLPDALEKAKIPKGGKEGQVLAKKTNNDRDIEWKDIETVSKEDLGKKLDKNLGTDNGNKVLITDAKGNITTTNKSDFEGGGTSDYNDLENKPSINGVELVGNKTSEELNITASTDNVLIGEVTKTENSYIDDSFERKMKNLKFYGKSTQVHETNIVPTPNRPIPISSRKIKAGETYVELRSLKETINMFDFRHYILLNSEYFSLSNDGLGIRVLKQDDRDISEIPYEIELPINSYLTFMWAGDAGQNIRLEIYIKYEGEEVWQESNIINDGTSNETLGIGNNKKVKMKFKFIGAVGAEKINIGLYDYSKDVTTYIPPPVRDYKLVDHVNKTAKIIRNVGVIDSYYNCRSHQQNDNYISFMLDNSFYDSTFPQMYKLSYSNLFEVDEWRGININKECNWIATGSLGFILNKSRNIITTEQANEFLTNNNAMFLYKLKTPTEETITYAETDTSEVGYSWQDTTSPSPTIPAEVKGVEEIDISVTGKNLINIDKIDKDTKITKIDVNITNTVIISCAEFANITKDVWRFSFAFKDGTLKYIVDSTLKKDDSYRVINVNEENPIVSITYRGELIESGQYAKIMLEYSSTATPYESYREQRVNNILPQTLYSTLDGNIDDEVNVESGEYEYYMKQKKLTGDEEWKEYKEEDKLNQFYFYFDGVNHNNDEARALSNIAKPIALANRRGNFGTVYSISGGIGFNIENLTLEEWKQFLKDNEVYIYYATTEIVKIPIPEDDLEQFKKISTFTGITNVSCNTSLSFEYEKWIQAVIDKITGQSQILIRTVSNLLAKGGK